MSIKRREFLALKQDKKFVREYLYEFNHLARYTPDDVSTDARKQDQFMNGLTEVLQLELAAHDFRDFQHLVDKAIVVENRMQVVVELRKRKWAAQKSASHSSQELRAWQSTFPGVQASTPLRPPMHVSYQPQCKI